MPTHRQKIGSWGEEQAVVYLKSCGYEIFARNVRTSFGEIDIVARKDRTIVFVEVKTRTSQSFGFPEEAVTAKKQEHLIAAAQAFLQSHSHFDGDWRIDVIAISGKPNQKPDILHFEDAVHG